MYKKTITKTVYDRMGNVSYTYTETWMDYDADERKQLDTDYRRRRETDPYGFRGGYRDYFRPTSMQRIRDAFEDYMESERYD